MSTSSASPGIQARRVAVGFVSTGLVRSRCGSSTLKTMDSLPFVAGPPSRLRVHRRIFASAGTTGRDA